MIKICRLALMNKEFIIKEGRNNILMFLNQLEKSCGGQGNGIMFIKDNKIETHCKGLTLSNELITDVLFDEKYDMPDWFLYHTRVASKGSVKNENCHPYVNAQESFGLMMNGTIGSFGAFGNYMNDITDTEALFKMLDTFNVDLEVLTELDPRFIGFKDGKVFASNSSSYSGLAFKTEKGAVCIASEAPTGKVWDKMEEEYLWTEGEEIKKSIPKTYGSYYNGYSNYGKGSSLNNQYYWSAGKWIPIKEEVKTDKPVIETEDEEDITIEEAIEIIEELKEEYPELDYDLLQGVIDDFFGSTPFLSGKYCEITVFPNNNVVIQDSEGEVHIA